MSVQGLRISPVFQGLTRPNVFWGVDYDYFLCSAMGVVLLFIWASSWQGQLIAIGLFFPLHLIGWLLCQRDPHIFKVLSVRASIGRVPNYSLWRCQSYAPF